MKSTMVSAYHNYLVERRLEMSFTVGDPEDKEGFFFVAHRVTPRDPIPLLSARLFNERGEFLLEMHRNRLTDNPMGFSFLDMREGCALLDTSLQALLFAEVKAFRNGFITIIRGTLHDEAGRLRLRGDHHGLHIIGL
jgi:hypothetical protein